jgi:hypothetical protein
VDRFFLTPVIEWTKFWTLEKSKNGQKGHLAFFERFCPIFAIDFLEKSFSNIYTSGMKCGQTWTNVDKNGQNWTKISQCPRCMDNTFVL